jgi:hypothetical protein
MMILLPRKSSESKINAQAIRVLAKNVVQKRRAHSAASQSTKRAMMASLQNQARNLCNNARLDHHHRRLHIKNPPNHPRLNTPIMAESQHNPTKAKGKVKPGLNLKNKDTHQHPPKLNPSYPGSHQQYPHKQPQYS